MGDGYSADLLQGDIEALRRAAGEAAGAADSMDGHRLALHPQADAAKAQWSGTAVAAFDNAHKTWEAGVIRLIKALKDLGDGTQFTATGYEGTDAEAAARRLAAATGVAPAVTAASNALSTSSRVATVQASVTPAHPVGAVASGAASAISRAASASRQWACIQR